MILQINASQSFFSFFFLAQAKVMWVHYLDGAFAALCCLCSTGMNLRTNLASV